MLVIDDDPRHLDLIRAALEPAGFHVTTASTGQEGLAAAKAHSFDLLLLDLVLPDLSGVEVIRALRTDGRSGDLPILLVTSQHLSAAERDRIRNDVLGIYAKSDLELGELADEIRAASHKR